MALSKKNLCRSTLLLPLVFFQIGCVTKTTDTPKLFEYVSLQPNAGFGVTFDTEALTITPQIENGFGIVPSNLRVCNSNSAYICFESDLGNLVFSFPRNLNEHQSWVFKNRQFDIVEVTSSTGCGPNYIVKAEKDGNSTELFEYNYVKGLRSIYPIDSIETIKLEFVEGKTYRFGEILIANGIGFGAAGNCSKFE